MKKSELVRQAIADAKSKQLSQEDVINAVREATGFGRRLARAYVLNNWDKVAAPKVQVTKTEKGLSMSKDAIRKREARARAKAAKAAEQAQAEEALM
jgi:hypothetical protein